MRSCVCLYPPRRHGVLQCRPNGPTMHFVFLGDTPDGSKPVFVFSSKAFVELHSAPPIIRVGFGGRVNSSSQVHHVMHVFRVELVIADPFVGNNLAAIFHILENLVLQGLTLHVRNHGSANLAQITI